MATESVSRVRRNTSKGTISFFSERDYVTFAICYRNSVCLSSNVGAPYLAKVRRCRQQSCVYILAFI